MKKKLIAVVAAASILLSSFLGGCQKSEKVMKKPFSDKVVSTFSSGTVAEKGDYALIWDEEMKSISFKCLSTGKIWSNIPDGYAGSSTNIKSPVNITVANASSLQWTTVKGYKDACKNGRVLCKKIKDGLRVTYCFDKYQIFVPIDYKLLDGALSVTVNIPRIYEGNEYKLIKVSVAPFLCSAKNSPEDAYIVIPSGSGALIYANETAENERTYTGEVFGEDFSRPYPDHISDKEYIRLPVFGIKDHGEALMGIIEKNAGSAVIEATAGNKRSGYSTVYPTFYVRGYDVYDKGVYGNLKDDLIRLSDGLSSNVSTVVYYPLTGEDASYIGMANKYRDYLKSKKLLKENVKDESSYSLTLLGGALTSTSVLGVPTKQFTEMTTFSEAQKIVDELKSATKENPNVRLKGFGSSGISYGKIGGGFKFNSKLGGKKDYSKFADFCSKNKIPMFTNFDIIRFSKSGEGFTKSNNAVKSAINKKVVKYPVLIPQRDFDEKHPYYILSRNKLDKAIDKVIDFAEAENITGISLSELGDYAYSDYCDAKYSTKGNLGKDVKSFADKIRKSGHKLAGGTNSYLAALADALFDVPVNNGNNISFDVRIPFYQMVFKGYKPIFGNPLNHSANVKEDLMLSASSGTGLSFSLIGNYNIDLNEITNEKLYGSLYKDNKEFIRDTVKTYNEFYGKIKNAQISNYEILADGITLTEFDNGVKVYANHTDTEKESPAGTLAAYGYAVK